MEALSSVITALQHTLPQFVEAENFTLRGFLGGLSQGWLAGVADVDPRII